MCGLVRTGSQFRELFQEIVSRRADEPVDIEKAIMLNLVLGMVSGFSSGQLSDFWARVSEGKLSSICVRMQILSHCRNTHTVYIKCVHIYTYRITRAYVQQG